MIQGASMTEMTITCGEDIPGLPYSIAPFWHYWFYLGLPDGTYVKVLPEMAEDMPEAIVDDLGLLEPRRSEALALLAEGVQRARGNRAHHQDCIEAQAEVAYNEESRRRWGIFAFLAPTYQEARSENLVDEFVLKVLPLLMIGSFVLTGLVFLVSSIFG